MSRPNILLIHSDQHRFDCVGANGHPFIQTPHLDSLALDGANFTHAFCPIPLCVPARGSLLSGTWPWQHGCIVNEHTEASRRFSPGRPLFSDILKEQGYALGYVGKWHLAEPDDPRQYSFDRFVSEEDYPEWRRSQDLPAVPNRNSWFGETDDIILPEQSRLAWTAGQAVSMLQEFAAQRKPFFLRWDPLEPHLPNVVPEPFASMYPPEMIPPWPSFADEFAGKPFIQRQQLRTWGLEDWTWEEWAPIVSRYLGEISLLDAQVGRLLAALDSLGITEETIVIYTSDHGDMCGGHRMIDKHFVMYDDVVRVPLLVRWPGKIPAGKVCDAFISSALDLASTFCDAASAPRPNHFMGTSFLPLAMSDSPADGRRPDIFASYHGNQFGLFSQRMLRDRRWKYVWNATAEDELYDLEEDPAELINRTNDPACAQELRRLRHRLITWMEGTFDPLLNEWTRRQLDEDRKAPANR